MRRLLPLFVLIVASCGSTPPLQASVERDVASPAEQPLEILRESLDSEAGFVKVHAAEALIKLSHQAPIADVFRNELEQHGNEAGYRAGIYRILAQAESRAEDRQDFINHLRRVYLEPRNPDRIIALESLAKVGYVPSSTERRLFTAALPDETEAQVCLDWLFANSGNESDLCRLADHLESDSERGRNLAAYALRLLPADLPADVGKRLLAAAHKEPAESSARIYLLAAACVKTPNVAIAGGLKEALVSYATSEHAPEKYELTLALADFGTAEDAVLLENLLSDPAADVRIGASYALQRLQRRQSPRFKPIDWFVLAGYGVTMLGIGWYFSRRSKTSTDYLLAGRAMKALPVGLSYFATLFSTITYLSTPGEVIRYGPMVLGVVLLYPLVFLIVGYILIPHITRLNVSTAYEILEKRFGVSVRMLGSATFMSLRLAWMSMILFGMSRFVLIPILDLNVTATPWVAVTLGLVTIIYTSQGGLQAVIWTDVAQTTVLLTGALLTLATITYDMGGVKEWWPAAWSSNWEPLRFWFDPTARLTIASAAVSQFTWYICTAGSDQMAVQRYLATKDSATARRMFAISLTCDTLVATLLVCIGLALLAFFQAHPELLPDRYTVITGADQLYPRFIVVGLPAGISGIIIAGLAAAAMSSLSSGLNSASSVITYDWVSRFWPKPLDDPARLRIARFTSWICGGVIVALSLAALGIEGNLLEKALRFINLFTAPLFVLFFMAMFVKRAKTWTAWMAGLSSATAAVLIAHTDVTGLSVFWIMPVALMTGISVGLVASLVPLGRSRPMLDVRDTVSQA